MQLFHTNCPEWKDRNTGPIPRFILRERSEHALTRTYTCNKCGATVHADMDWAEGVEVVRGERLD